MARPIKNNADYFSHDVSMRNDMKIKALRRKYSMVGYAIYVMMLEIIAWSDGFEFSIKQDDIIAWEMLAGDMDIDTIELKAIIEYMTTLELLVYDGSKIWSNWLKKRLIQVVEKRSRMQANAMQRWNKSDNNDAIAYENDAIALVSEAETIQSKVKESKEKESKVNIYPKGYSESEDSQPQDFENKNEGETSQSSEDSTITLVLDFLKKEIGVPDFKESKNTQRAQARNIRDLKNEIGEIEFKRRLENLKADKLKFMNCNSIANLFGELKSSRITLIPAPKAPILPAVHITLLDDTIPERDPEESARIKAELDAKVARLKRASPTRPNILMAQHA